MRAQLSFLPVLLQVRVARGGTEPARHFTSSEGHAPAGGDKWGHPWLAQSRDHGPPTQLGEGCSVGIPEQHLNPPPTQSSLRCDC